LKRFYHYREIIDPTLHHAGGLWMEFAAELFRRMRVILDIVAGVCSIVPNRLAALAKGATNDS
jgi:hypothetical protein